jgi:single-stranded DNA-binding protein
MFRVAVSGRREQEPSFFTVVVWRDQADHAAESLAKGSRVMVVGRLQQRAWTAEGRQRPPGHRGRGRGAGAKPAVGDGDHDQGDAQYEPGASLTSDATSGTRSMSAFRLVVSVLFHTPNDSRTSGV